MNHLGIQLAAAVLDVTVKVVLILVAASIAARIARRSPAATRHLIWTIALVATLAVPLIEPLAARRVLFPIAVQASAPVTIDSGIAPAQPVTSATDAELAQALAMASEPEAPPDPKVDFSVWLAWIWAAGAVAVALTLVAGWIAVRRIRSRPAALPRPLGIRPNSSVEVHISCEGRPPAALTWGAWRHRVLLPREAATWSEDRLQTVLLHEFEHIRRLDSAKQFIGAAACAVHWFNPLIWMAARAARAEAEAATDDAVLRSGILPSAYAATLIEVAAEIGGRTSIQPSVGVAFMKNTKIETRLRAILDRRSRRTVTRSERLIALGIAAAILAPLVVVKAAAVQAFATLDEPEVSVQVDAKADLHRQAAAKHKAELAQAHHLRALAHRLAAKSTALATNRKLTVKQADELKAQIHALSMQLSQDASQVAEAAARKRVFAQLQRQYGEADAVRAEMSEKLTAEAAARAQQGSGQSEATKASAKTQAEKAKLAADRAFRQLLSSQAMSTEDAKKAANAIALAESMAQRDEGLATLRALKADKKALAARLGQESASVDILEAAKKALAAPGDAGSADRSALAEAKKALAAQGDDGSADRSLLEAIKVVAAQRAQETASADILEAKKRALRQAQLDDMEGLFISSHALSERDAAKLKRQLAQDKGFAYPLRVDLGSNRKPADIRALKAKIAGGKLKGEQLRKVKLQLERAKLLQRLEMIERELDQRR